MLLINKGYGAFNLLLFFFFLMEYSDVSGVGSASVVPLSSCKTV